MALISCKDCGKEISDSAKSCPHCGAPVPRTIRKDEQQCPFCMTVMPMNAIICPGCKSKKGYLYTGNYGVMGKTSVIIWIILFVFLSIISIGTWASFIAWIFIPLALYFIYNLLTGPKWYASKHVS